MGQRLTAYTMAMAAFATPAWTAEAPLKFGTATSVFASFEVQVMASRSDGSSGAGGNIDEFLENDGTGQQAVAPTLSASVPPSGDLLVTKECSA